MFTAHKKICVQTLCLSKNREDTTGVIQSLDKKETDNTRIEIVEPKRPQ